MADAGNSTDVDNGKGNITLLLEDWIYDNAFGQNVTENNGDRTVMGDESLTMADANVGPCDQGFPYFRWIVYMFGITPLIVFGIIGNCLALLVLLRKYRCLSIGVLLIGLTVVDTLLLLLMGTIHIWMIVQQCHGLFLYGFHYLVMYRICYPMVFVLRMCVVGISVCMAYNRWVVVCRPMVAKYRLSPVLSLMQLVVVLSISLLFSLPRFFELELVDGRLAITAMVKQVAYNVVYRTCAFSLSMYIIPISYIIVKCCVIIRRFSGVLLYRDELHQANSAHSTDVIQATRITLSVILLTVLCNVPAFCTHIIWSISYIEKDIDMPSLAYVTVLSNLAIAVSSAANTLVYCWFGQGFRREFKDMSSSLKASLSCRCLTHEAANKPDSDETTIKEPLKKASNVTSLGLVSTLSSNLCDETSF